MARVEGSKRSIEARLLLPGQSAHDLRDFTYQVIAATKAEVRSSARRRLRFQTGKLTDAQGRFVSECLIHDRSDRGLRLCLAKDVAIPSSFGIYVDRNGEMLRLRAVWRSGTMIGAAFAGAHNVGHSQRRSLGAPLYAVRN